jgi:hypothetical protein
MLRGAPMPAVYATATLMAKGLDYFADRNASF